MVSGEIAGLLQESTEADFEQEVTEITEELRRNRPHQGIQGTKGKEPLLAIGPLGTAGRSQEGLNAVAQRRAKTVYQKKSLTVGCDVVPLLSL